MMFCIILIILDFSVLSRQNMKIKNAENKQTIKQYSAYAKNVFEKYAKITLIATIKMHGITTFFVYDIIET